MAFLKLSLVLATFSLSFSTFAASHDVEIRIDHFMSGLESIDLSKDIPIDHSTCGLLITGVSASVHNMDARRNGSLDLVFDGLSVDRNFVIGELGNHYQAIELSPRRPQPLCNRVSRVELSNTGGTTLHIQSLTVHLEDPAPNPALQP